MIEAHVIKRTLTEVVIDPSHVERIESSEFRHAKERLKADGHFKCWVCGATENLQVHHFGAEWRALFSNANAELGALFFTIAATITVKFLADITSKATLLFNGLQIQSPITVIQPQPAQQELSQPAANIKPEVTQ